MVKNSFIGLHIDSKRTAEIECPIAGKGFSRILVCSTTPDFRFSLNPEIPENERYAINQTPQLIDFTGGDNTVPRKLYILNNGVDGGSVFLLIEEVGSNPV